MHIVILGAGSLGTLFGAKVWAGANTRVTLVSRGTHLQRMRTDGIRLMEMSGDSRLVGGAGLDVVENTSDVSGEIDYLIVTVKGGDFESAIDTAEDLPPVTSVLTLQNGVRFNSRLIETFGRDRVIGAVTMEGAAMPEPGTVQHILAATTYVGELDGRRSKRVDNLVSLLESGSLHTEIATDITSATWTKFVQSCASSGVCGVTRLGYAPATATAAGAELYLRLVREGVGVMRAKGLEPGPYLGESASITDIVDTPIAAAITRVRDRARKLIAAGYVGGTSLLRDLERGNVSEASFLMGDMVRAADELGVATPTMSAVALGINAVDQSR